MEDGSIKRGATNHKEIPPGTIAEAPANKQIRAFGFCVRWVFMIALFEALVRGSLSLGNGALGRKLSDVSVGELFADGYSILLGGMTALFVIWWAFLDGPKPYADWAKFGLVVIGGATVVALWLFLS